MRKWRALWASNRIWIWNVDSLIYRIYEYRTIEMVCLSLQCAMEYGHLLLISLHNITWSICGARLTNVRTARRFGCVCVCHCRWCMAPALLQRIKRYKRNEKWFACWCLCSCLWAQIQRLTYFEYDELPNRFWHVGVGCRVRMEWIEAMWWQRKNSSVVNKESQFLYSAYMFPDINLRTGIASIWIVNANVENRRWLKEAQRRQVFVYYVDVSSIIFFFPVNKWCIRVSVCVCVTDKIWNIHNEHDSQYVYCLSSEGKKKNPWNYSYFST